MAPPRRRGRIAARALAVAAAQLDNFILDLQVPLPPSLRLPVFGPVLPADVIVLDENASEHGNDEIPERAIPAVEPQAIPVAHQQKDQEDRIKELEREIRERVTRELMEEMREKKRKEQEKARAQKEKIRLEAVQLQKELDKAKEVENETSRVFVYRESAYQAKKVAREEEKVEFQRQEREAMEEIKRLQEELDKKKEKLESMRETDDDKEQKFSLQVDILKRARTTAAKAKEDRARLARNLENHVHTQSLRYSRACPICANGNPSRRAAMTNCGHISCLECTETLWNLAEGCMVTCPVCRRLSKYTRLYEDLASERDEPPRKRRHENEGSPSVSSTSE